ncbi:hypothetical protein LMG9964_06353 [Paraburkholderia phenoliruptrix]|uniref:Uncharacterized protein n=1 Tax=Paraburkholderia phenoliruptrix TaxID=252970 RepID=A0A6J5KEI2_9BURK|nr:hypothetical protein [Paraburkholderia phenoliruptrix]CAB4052663.1 hypothetical protein LMG9964_06353 [Paraburkholderia phenoliruptrix]
MMIGKSHYRHATGRHQPGQMANPERNPRATPRSSTAMLQRAYNVGFTFVN